MRRFFVLARMNRSIACLFMGVLGLSSYPLEADADRQQEIEMLIPVVIGQIHYIECEAMIAPQSGEVRLLWSGLEEFLNELLTEDRFGTLMKRVQSDNYLPLQALNLEGLEAAFDEQSLEVTVQVPPRLLRTRTVSLGGGVIVDESIPSLGPSDLSGYLNVRMLGEARTGGDRNEGLQIPLLGLEQVIKVRDWAFEFAGVLDWNSDASWERQYTRLIRDLPSKRVRYAFGDLRSSPVSFQESVSMFGVSVERENRLQPFHQPRPRAQSELFIEHDSEVEIFVNGVRLRRLQLSPGPYRIEDLQLAAGSTDVLMVVRDKYGVEKQVDLSFSFDQSLLAADETDYYLGMGVRPNSGVLKDGYEWGQPIVSGFYRQGRSDVLTSDWNFQASRDVAQAGAKAIWATKLGSFRGELSSSVSRLGGIGYAVGLSYIRYAGHGLKSKRQGQWRTDLYHYSPEFRGIDSPAGGRPVLDYRVTHSRQLPWGIGSSFGAGYQHRGSGSPDSVSARASVSRRFSRRFSSRLNLSFQHGSGRETVFGASLRFEWSFGAGQRHRMAAGLDTVANARDLQYSYQPSRQLRSWRGNADLKQFDGGPWQGDLRAGYTSSRFDFDAGQSFATREGQLTSVSRFQLGSSLAFAGGHWGISRPINDSFAVVTGHDSLRGIPIGINDLGQGPEARLDRWGPAVISEVQSYYPKTVHVDAPDELAFGYDLGPGKYLLNSTYRSGSHFTIGSEPTVFARGRLIDDGGSPISLEAGEVHHLTETGWDPQTVFTTREGVLMIDGLGSGEYELRWFDETLMPVIFRIPQDSEGSVELGTLEVRTNGEKNYGDD